MRGSRHGGPRLRSGGAPVNGVPAKFVGYSLQELAY